MVDLWGPRAFGAADAASSRPPYTPANAGGDVDSHYQDCSSPSNDDGTEWRAAALNALLAQLRGVVRRSGVGDNNLDDALLVKALRTQRPNYAAGVWSGSNLTVALAASPASWDELVNAPLDIRMPSNNAGASQLVPTGLAGKTIRRRDGTAIQKDDLVGGVVYRMRYDGVDVRLDVPSSGETKLILRGDLTLYVRIDGNDANSGLADNAAGAFRTIQAAVNAAVSRYDTAGFTVYITVRAGFYNEAVTLSRTGTTNIVMIGDTASPASVIIGPPAGEAVTATISSRLTIFGFRLQAVAGSALAAYDGSSIRFGRIDFGVTLNAHVYSAQQSFIVADDWYTVSAAAAVHAQAISNATITMTGRAVSFLGAGNQNYNAQFVRASGGGRVFVDGMTFGNAGVVICPRYLAEVGGMIWTAGGGANYLPGTISGTVATGGAYY